LAAEQDAQATPCLGVGARKRSLVLATEAGDGRCDDPLGIILLIIGIVVKSVHFLLVIGIVLLVIGLILVALGAMGRAVGGRRHYF